jgi:hypothetical protein
LVFKILQIANFKLHSSNFQISKGVLAPELFCGTTPLT